jgi:methylenetetrahydrofolate dehydrogenase (NADP+)/methenyltetrahydrofolate cyclohydrolase
MTARLIDGKTLASEIRRDIRRRVDQRRSAGLRAPGLAVIMVGNDPASAIYVRNKHHACEQVDLSPAPTIFRQALLRPTSRH